MACSNLKSGVAAKYASHEGDREHDALAYGTPDADDVFERRKAEHDPLANVRAVLVGDDDEEANEREKALRRSATGVLNTFAAQKKRGAGNAHLGFEQFLSEAEED